MPVHFTPFNVILSNHHYISSLHNFIGGRVGDYELNDTAERSSIHFNRLQADDRKDYIDNTSNYYESDRLGESC